MRFKCLTGDAADALFGVMSIDGFGFDVELLYAAKKRGLSIVQVPIQWHYQPRSKIRPLRDSVLMLNDILRIRLRSLAGRYDPDANAAPGAVPILGGNCLALTPGVG